MTRALIATDGSLAAVEAARTATRLLHESAYLTVLHVLVPPIPAIGARTGNPVAYQRLEQSARRMAARAIEATVSVLDRRADTREVAGDAGAVICAIAGEVAADVIVMGSRGAGGVRRVLLGSTSLYVLNHAPCPVLVFRDELTD